MLNINVRKDYSQNINYNLPDMPVFINRTQIETDIDLSVECHWHDDVEFFVIVSGNLKYNVNGECIELGAGEGLFINSRQMHYGYSIGKNKCDCICVIVDPILFCTNKYITQTFITPIINKDVPYIFLNKENPIFNYIYEMCEVFTQKENSYALIIHSLFYKIWSLLYDNMPLQNYTNQNFKSDLNSLKDMVGFIHTHFREKVRLADIACSGSVCQSICCNIFQEFLHQTPIGYLTFHRLCKSVELLKNTSLTINDIALSVGFSGASYFTETFRKYYSQSPSEFRSKNIKRIE